MTYFQELMDLKKKQMYLGENDKGTMDLMGNFQALNVQILD